MCFLTWYTLYSVRSNYLPFHILPVSFWMLTSLTILLFGYHFMEFSDYHIYDDVILQPSDFCLLAVLDPHFHSPWNVLIRTRHCPRPNLHPAYRMPKHLALNWAAMKGSINQMMCHRPCRILQQPPRSQIHQWLCFSRLHRYSHSLPEHWFKIQPWYLLRTVSTSIVSTSGPWSHQSWRSISKRECATDVGQACLEQQALSAYYLTWIALCSHATRALPISMLSIHHRGCLARWYWLLFAKKQCNSYQWCYVWLSDFNNVLPPLFCDKFSCCDEQDTCCTFLCFDNHSTFTLLL